MNHSRMLELPNYSSQLMQQLWALRKGGHFCDCTILVGDSPHRAHKLLLAASSMLFRSLLATSDTISIDTAVVSSQEFNCLLDMVYTGKLPLGKHNVSRIIAAADNLQMFDVAIGFKKVLSTIVNPQPSPSVVLPLSASQGKIQRDNPDSSALPKNDQSLEKNESPSKKEQSSSDKNKTDVTQDGDSQCTDEPASKRACPGPEDTDSSENKGAAAERPSAAVLGVLERSSELMELLTNMATITNLLSQAAQSRLNKQDQQVVSECCEETDPAKALEKLLGQVKGGMLSEAAFLTLLWAVHQNAPSSVATPLQRLLDELERCLPGSTPNQHKADSKQNGSGAEDTHDQDNINEDPDYKDKECAPSPSSIASPTSKPYTCRCCKKAFDYKCRLLAHMERCSKSKEGKHQCPQCPQKLPTQRALLRHQAQAHEHSIKKKVDCELCRRTFAHPSGMMYHMRTEHFEEKPFSCEECGAKFGANSSLKNHMRLHTGEKPYTCKHCDKSFTVAAGLAYHTKKKHSEGKMYVCQYCKAEFAQSIELTRHVRTHTGDRPYVCRECGKGYSQASGLTAHLHTSHSMSEPRDCQKCCLSFSSLSEHECHIQDIHPNEFYKCPVCEKVLPSATLLNKHKSSHSGSKLFSCDLCNKSYQQLSGLWYHNRTNHPDVFANHTRQLKALVQCDVCFKFFPSEDSLAQHQAKHKGLSGPTVSCPFCPAVFAGDDWLHEHINTRHVQQSEVVGCSLCSLLCGSTLELQEHMLSVHMEPQEQEEPGMEVPAEMAEGRTEEGPVSADSLLDVEQYGADKEISEGQSHLEKAQQVFVALANGQESSEVVEVSMFDWLSSSVTFICQDKASEP